jgi:hypothetical protein
LRKSDWRQRSVSVTAMTQPVSPFDGSSYTFSPHDIERLRVYRAAVKAGFYNELTEPVDGVQQLLQRENLKERQPRKAAERG